MEGNTGSEGEADERCSRLAFVCAGFQEDRRICWYHSFPSGHPDDDATFSLLPPREEQPSLNELELVLEQEEVVGGCDGDDVLVRVPGGVQDLLVEVKAVNVDLVLLPLATRANLKENEIF